MKTPSVVKQYPLVIVAGLSGSGKSTALNVFEDMDFFTADGVPLHLVPQMVQLFAGPALEEYKGLALGVDLRNIEQIKDYTTIIQEIQNRGFDPQLIFFEAKAERLMQRYATTRRPHPLEKEGLGLEKAIERERERLTLLRSYAELVVDTSAYSIHDLRRTLQDKWKSLDKAHTSLRVHLISFGFKYGTPAEADMVFDLRFLANPYFNPELRPMSGRDEPIRDYVLGSEQGATFFNKLSSFLLYLLRQNEEEGRYRLTIAIGCTGGRHRSVAIAEALVKLFNESRYSCSLEHRHLNLG